VQVKSQLLAAYEFLHFVYVFIILYVHSVERHQIQTFVVIMQGVPKNRSTLTRKSFVIFGIQRKYRYHNFVRSLVALNLFIIIKYAT